MPKLDHRQVVPLTSDDLERLRAAAKASDLSAGLFSRALLRYALDRLADPGLLAGVETERDDAAARTSAGARAAIAQRWEK